MRLKDLNSNLKTLNKLKTKKLIALNNDEPLYFDSWEKRRIQGLIPRI